MFQIGLALPVNLLLFLLTVYLLNRLLLRPLQAVMAERERLTSGSQADSRQIIRQHQEIFERYRSAVRGAQAEGYRFQDEARAEMARWRQRRLAEARQRAEEDLVRMKDEIARQVAESKALLQRESEALSEGIAAKLLAQSA